MNETHVNDMNETHVNETHMNETHNFTQQIQEKQYAKIRINKQLLRARARTHTQNTRLSTRLLRKHNTQTQHVLFFPRTGNWCKGRIQGVGGEHAYTIEIAAEGGMVFAPADTDDCIRKALDSESLWDGEFSRPPALWSLH